MTTTLNTELEHNRSRLAYYSELREKKVSPKVTDKWIEIYSERVAKIERQIKKAQLLAAQQQEAPGLKVQLQKPAQSSRSRRA